MKEIILKIPNEKFSFFKELMQQLDFEVSEVIEIPEEHKAIVRERIRKSGENPDQLLEWDKVRDSFKLD